MTVPTKKEREKKDGEKGVGLLWEPSRHAIQGEENVTGERKVGDVKSNRKTDNNN